MDLRYHTLDVFTDRPFGGNPLAVFPEGRELSTATMQALTRELNLSETVFVLPPADVRHAARLRIFTPGGELPFAGHPTVGTAALLADLGLVPGSGDRLEFVVEEGVGPVPMAVDRRDGRACAAELTTAVLPTRGRVPASLEEIAALLSLAPADLAAGADAPESWSCGVSFLFVPLVSRAALARARIDSNLHAAMDPERTPREIFLFCREPELPGSDLRARMFAPGLGVVEDPATGSAVAALAGYLAAREGDASGERTWRVEQGFEMGRPSLLRLTVDLAAGTPTRVRVGGSVVRMSEGAFRLP